MTQITPRDTTEPLSIEKAISDLPIKPFGYYDPPQVGDTVVIAATPFIVWLIELDKSQGFGSYDYQRLPPRADKLDRWLWTAATVIKLKPPSATLKASGLGVKDIPISCLRVLRRP